MAAHTLGCKLNFAETSQLLRKLAEYGHTVVDFKSEADLYIINTCTVTAVAERKCRNAVRQATRQNPQAKVVVTGCYAETEQRQIERIPGVSIVLGNDKKHLLAEIVEHAQTVSPDDESQRPALPDLQSGATSLQSPTPAFAPAWSSTGRTRAFVKIQDGCDYFCTYCAIPIARGRSRSATVDEVVDMVEQCAGQGAKEVVLTGVNTGTFGQHTGESLLDLLRRLDDIEAIRRYRISSIEPNLLTDEIIDFTARSRAFLPHFHIPMQAGSDPVLRLMHRRYDTSLYRERVAHIKSLMPDACIAADIIAGFNGETESDFQATKAFVDSLPISYLHVFTYSERPHTAALKITPRTDVAERRRRSRELHCISQKKLKLFVESQVGKQRPVLWESDNHQGEMHGLTDNYIRLRRAFDPVFVNAVTLETITHDNAIADVPE